MTETGKSRPTYAGAFRCIGSACEDDCCHSWNIPVDKATYERYTLFPADKLGWAVTGFVSVTSAQVPDSLYAHIHMAASGDCPFLEADRLCGIHKAYGAELLSSTCSSYPRVLNRVEGMLEGSLSLSCPEAARNVLLDATFLERVADLERAAFRTDNFFWRGNQASSAVRKPFEAFHAVRAAMIELVRDRSRPVWLRLLRVGALCQRLEGTEPAATAIAEVLKGKLDQELLALPENRALRLEVSMRHSDERARDPSSGTRFREAYWGFIEGIAGGPGSGNDLERFAWAERKYYQPLMAAHPHLWENFLVNYIFQRLFPFGRAGGVALRERGIFEEFVLLATQFGWIETLLIGLAGRWQEDFAGTHIVEAVQSFHREVEHDAGVLEGIVSDMARRGMSNLAGIAVMLR